MHEDFIMPSRCVAILSHPNRIYKIIYNRIYKIYGISRNVEMKVKSAFY